MLSDRHRVELDGAGVTFLRGAVPPAEVAAVEALVWAHFARTGVDRDDRTTWPTGFQSKLQGLRQGGALNSFACPDVTSLIDVVLGAGQYEETEGWGPALVTFPEPGSWVLPHRGWHLDLPGSGDPSQPGAVRLFGFVSEVEPQGGGTLVVEGSHHLVRMLVQEDRSGAVLSSKRIARRLSARYEWFRMLLRPHSDREVAELRVGVDIDDVTVRVVELTGRPGDVALMLPWTMHAISTNASSQPRMMVTHSVYRRDQSYYPAVPSSAKRGPAPVDAAAR